MKRQLAEILAPVIGEVCIENLTTLTGGASRTTWAFEAVRNDSRHALILRTGQPDDVHAGMELEAAVQQLAAAAGAPVPHILAADNSPAAPGNPYLICNAIAGETIVRKIHRNLDSAGGDAGRDRLLRQCAGALAAIHRANPDNIGLTETEQLTEWRDRLDEMGDTTATFEWAFRWLAAHRPTPTPPRLVHGDFRTSAASRPNATCRGRLRRSSWPRSAAASAKPNGMCWICWTGSVPAHARSGND